MGLPKGPAPKMDDGERRQKFLAALAGGASRKAASLAAGVADRNTRIYLQRCGGPDASGDERRFLKLVEDAEDAGEATLADVILKAATEPDKKTGRPDWRASAWLLERTRPERWGLKREAEAPAVGLIEMLRNLDKATITGERERVTVQLSKTEEPTPSPAPGTSPWAHPARQLLPPSRAEDRVFDSPEEAMEAQRDPEGG